MINMAQILGRVGKMDVKATSSGVKIVNLSMVTSKKITKNGQKEEEVIWHNITMFNKIAEIAEKYVAVGDLLYIQGEMKNQKYTTQEGQERMKHFILAHDLKLIPKAKQHNAEPKQKFQEDSFNDDDLPW